MAATPAATPAAPRSAREIAGQLPGFLIPPRGLGAQRLVWRRSLTPISQTPIRSVLPKSVGKASP